MADNNNTIVLASDKLAVSLGVEKAHMLHTIKAQCFRNTSPDKVSDTQLAAYVQIASNLNLNPLLPGMLYAYPERNGGITPIIGPDGVFLMLSNNPDVEGWSTKHEVIGDEAACTATIKHKRLGEISKTVFLSEWKVPNNPNWAARPRHMLEIRALKQCARQVIHGVPFDEDEYTARAVDSGLANEAPPPVDVKAEAPKRPKAPARSTKGAVDVRDDAAIVADGQKAAEEPAASDAGEAVGEFTPVEPEAAQTAEPVTKLTAGQRVTFDGLKKIDVMKKIFKTNANPDGKMGIVAEVSGAFAGKVYHFGGAEDPAWAGLETPVSLTLYGQQLKNGDVLAVVEKAEITK